MAETVVTEIQISSSQMEAALARIETAYGHLGERAAAAEARAQAALERTSQSLKGLPQSVDRVQAAYDRLQASIDPVFGAQLRAEQAMTKSLAVVNRAVLLGLATEEQAARDVAALRSQQVIQIEKVREAQERLSAATQQAARLEGLRQQFDADYAASQRLGAELADLAELERSGIQITGGYGAALEGLVLKYDKTAQAAARAAEAELDFITKARAAQDAANAQQTATANQGRFNQLLGVNDNGATARDSAAVFEAELSRIDEIARLKGEQAGQQFGAAFNQSVTANLSWKSASASASVFMEADRQAQHMAVSVAALRAELNPLAAAQDRVNAEIAEYVQWAAKGEISAEELAKAQALARGRATSSVNGVNQFGVFTSAQQFQDIAVTAMMGQNLTTIGLQQGLQLGTGMQMSLGEKGAAGAVKVLGGALTSLLSPINLIAIAGTVAAAGLIQWFTSAGDTVEEAKAKTEAYLKSIDAINASIGHAGNAIDEFARKSNIELEAAERRARAVLELAAQNQNKDLLGQLNPLNTGTLFGSFQSSDVKSVFAPFQSAIDDLRAGLRSGNPDFDAFEKHIRAISATDPGNLNRWGDELIRTAEEAANSNRLLTGTADGLRDLSTINPNTVAAQQAIQDIGTTAEGVTLSIKNLIIQGQAITNMLAGMDAIARGVAPKGDAVTGKGSLDRAQESFDEAFAMYRRFGYDNDSKIDPNKPKKTKVDHSAERAANAYRDLIKSADDRLAQMKLEAEVSGMVGIAADALRFKLDLLQKGEEKGRHLSPDQRAEIEKKAKVYEVLATAAATAQQQQELLFDRAQLFRSPIDQQIASMQQSAGLPIDLHSTEADMMRLNTQIGLTQDAWRDFGDSAEDALTRLVSGTGSWRDVLVSMIPVAKDLILQLLKANSIGAGGSGDFSIGGLLAKAAGSLFGGGLGGGAMDPFQDVFASAKGNVFSGPGISAYSNSIVDRPTLFPFAKGVGLMGEAGEEAIMPLRRGPDGKLGVAAANQNGTTFLIIDQRTNAPAIEQEISTGPNGEQVTRLIVRDEIKRSGVGSVAQHARNHQEAKKRSMIK